MIRRPPRSTQSRSSAASDVYKRQVKRCAEKLVEAGYLRSNVKKGVGVEYYDTGLAGLRIQVSGYTYHEVKNNQALSEPAHRELPSQLTGSYQASSQGAVSYTHLRAHETVLELVCRLLLEKKKHKIE